MKEEGICVGNLAVCKTFFDGSHLGIYFFVKREPFRQKTGAV